MASTAREIMTGGVECIGASESVQDAAKKMDSLGVGALPICGDDQRLNGMITDRDIAIKVVAQGKDPASTKAGELGSGKPVTIAPTTASTSWSAPCPSTSSSACRSSTATSWSAS